MPEKSSFFWDRAQPERRGVSRQGCNTAHYGTQAVSLHLLHLSTLEPFSLNILTIQLLNKKIDRL